MGETGIAVLGATREWLTAAPPPRLAAHDCRLSADTPSLRICCLGRFSARRAGAALPLSDIRPQARSVLALLAVHGGMHREDIIGAVWPDAEPDAGVHRLHVAVCSIRKTLEPLRPSRSPSLVAREGDAYRIDAAADVTVDVAEFEASLSAARLARRAGDMDGALGALEGALDLYRGDLLPEQGRPEWVLAPRERLRARASDAAYELSTTASALGRYRPAITAAERGLEVDRTHDGLWQALIESHARAGDYAAAAAARRRYRDVLADLDVRLEYSAGSVA